MSKTDPAALGCERKWGCTCVSTPGVGCPFHAAAAQVALLCDRFPEKVEKGDAYLFPDASGEMVTNAAMEAFVDALADMAGQALTLPSGVRRFGKHSFRSTGAVVLARLGIEVFKIQLLARWASDVVLHYARGAPMETITSQVRSALADKTVTDLIEHLTAEVSQPKEDMAKMDTHTAKLLDIEAEVVRLTQEAESTPAAKEDTEEAQYVINTITNKCHKILTRTGNPRNWKTRCTWVYGLGYYEICSSPPSGSYKDLCDTCLHALRSERKAAQDLHVS